MLGFPTYRFVPVLLFICACPTDGTAPGPLDTETASETDDGATGLASGDDPTIMGPTGPDPVPTTTSSPDPETSAGTGGGDGTTTDESSAGCGPPCPDTWTHDAFVILDGKGANFTCLHTITKDLYIGPDATSAELASLANLEVVQGEVTIAGNLGLAGLAGLDCLRDVESLTITGMPQLSDLSALSRLQRAPQIVLDDLGITALPTFAPEFDGLSSLTLRNNGALVDLHPAATWGAGPGLKLAIHNNAVLPGLVGLSGLLADNGANPVRIELADLPKLVTLAGLEPVVSADLSFERLPKLPDLGPLANLAVGGQITFNDMPAIVDLAGLGGLASVGTFTIGNCVQTGTGGLDGLKSLAGLDNLVSVDHFAVAENDQLSSLAGAPALTHLQHFAAVANPALSPLAYESFIAKFDPVPSGCLGDWDRCPCFHVNPG